MKPMHFEILVEDESGKKILDILVPKILGKNHTFKVISYKGIGRIPKNLTPKSDADKRILLDRLPKLLQGYGKTFAHYPKESPVAVIVVCDLDDKCLKAFRKELDAILIGCHPRPETRFCIAVEEMEAWLLGDLPAVRAAYPKAKEGILKEYDNDAVCGTWEVLAEALFKGGAKGLSGKGWQAVGKEKSLWAECIAPRMDAENNASQSFVYFREKLREFIV